MEGTALVERSGRDYTQTGGLKRLTTNRDPTTEPEASDSQIVAGRYEVLDTLHVGQDGEVLAVRDLIHPERSIVCKRVTGRGAASTRAARLEHEYRLLSSLRHPGLPRARDFGYDLAADATILICDRAPGQTLEALAPLAVDEVVAVAVDLCRALSLLHARSWLHLDVKPRNVLWDPASGASQRSGAGPLRWRSNGSASGICSTSAARATSSGPGQLEAAGSRITSACEDAPRTPARNNRPPPRGSARPE